MTNKRFIASVFAMLAIMACSPAVAKPSFGGIFADHAVLQRDHPVVVWGQATASANLKISIADVAVEATADSQGNWRATLPVMRAGGPYTISVTDQTGETQTLTDILIGDVFLCSGQSNMAMTVKASMNGDAEIKSANHESIRLFNVALASAASPQSRLLNSGEWKTATFGNVAEFSAVCFYFARELQPQINVPIGLINAAWGGSAIEAWIGADELAGQGHADEIALLEAYIKDEKAAQARFGAGWQSWWTHEFATAGMPWSDRQDESWASVPLPMRDWKRWNDTDLAQHNGMLWFRKSFTLTPEQAKQGAVLHLGAIDEIDMTWLNGKPVAQSFGWGTNRDYPLANGMLRAGKNEIATNIYSGWDMGGMFGPANAVGLEMEDGNTVKLADGWMFKKAPKGAAVPPRAPWLPMGGLTSIGNAMIAPVAPYGLRGVVWYQGESNAANAKDYRSLLAALMRDWRKKFGVSDLPFLIVQLPAFGQAVVRPASSDWSDLRDAQRLAVLDDKAAGLAVAIDAGENDDIHPPNKQIVGRRLARLARSLIYRQDVTANGPVPVFAVRTDGKISIAFRGIDGRLVVHSATSPVAFEVCGIDQSSCRFADAKIEGDTVILSVADTTDVRRVRYCWGDAPVCNLYDAAGLPAGPFELEVS